MAQVKLEEEQELWEPAEEEHSVSVNRSFKEEPECREIQIEDIRSVVHCKKEEPEEVEIKAEPSVKREEPQSSLLHQMATEKNREDTGSSDTDGSEDWAASVEKYKEQLHGPAHRNNVSDGNKAKRHTCPDCGKSYKCFAKLRIHQRSHTGERPFRCTVCEKGFISNSKLIAHMRTHTGERPFRCPVCEKGFTEKRNLNKHMRIHTEEIAFRCTMCGKGFITKSNLNRHIRRHTRDRPFRCTVCEKGFISNSKLNEHMRTHNREKPFKCPVCVKDFTQMILLNRHMSSHTKGNRSNKCVQN